MTSEKRQLFSSTALRQEKITTQFAQLNNGFPEYRAKKVKMKMKEFYSYLLQEHLQHKTKYCLKIAEISSHESCEEYKGVRKSRNLLIDVY